MEKEQQQIIEQLLHLLNLAQGGLGITITDDTTTDNVNGSLFVTRTVTVSDGKNTITLLKQTAPIQGDPKELKAKVQEQIDKVQANTAKQVETLQAQADVFDSVITQSESTEQKAIKE